MTIILIYFTKTFLKIRYILLFLLYITDFFLVLKYYFNEFYTYSGINKTFNFLSDSHLTAITCIFYNSLAFYINLCYNYYTNKPIVEKLKNLFMIKTLAINGELITELKIAKLMELLLNNYTLNKKIIEI